jgi:signal transduction histidine kinase
VRVSTKMTLGICGVSLLIGGLHGFSQLRQERTELREVIDREIRILGNAIQVSFQNALRDSQFSDIQGALDSLEGIAPDLDLFVFSPNGALRAQSAGSVDEPALESFAMRAMRTRTGVLDIDETRRWRATLGLPLVDDAGGNIGAIVLVRPLGEMRRDLASTGRGIALSLVALVAAITGLQAFLGTVWLTRPLTKIAEGMQHLRAGEPAVALGSRRSDEVGRLVTEFDALVADLRSAHERIAHEVESRLALEAGLQRVDKLVTIGQLSAGLAHEIGSPLQIMSGRARALIARDLNPEEVRKNAMILAEQSDRIAGIVEQLLSFARRRPARLAETDLAVPVKTILDLVTPAARRRRIGLEFHGRPDLPRVVADVDQIQQVVLNLLKNALAATADGGNIRIHLDFAALEATDGEIPAARLTVEDDGCGMTEDARAHVFEPFFTTRAAEGGTGLGLAVVRAIVQAHGGTVSVASQVGTGTRFTVDLPFHGGRT